MAGLRPDPSTRRVPDHIGYPTGPLGPRKQKGTKMSDYTILIEARTSAFESPEIWQALLPAETVESDLSAAQVAREVAVNQDVAFGDDWRVQVWEGSCADTGIPSAGFCHALDLCTEV